MSDGLKTKIVTIEKGRDAGKTFEITEMPAIQADDWAHDLLYNASMSGMDLKNVDVLNLNTNSMAGMIEVGAMVASIIGRIPKDDSKRMKFDLLDRCVKIVPTGGNPRACQWDSEIKDFQNFTILFGHAVGIHINFLKQDET